MRIVITALVALIAFACPSFAAETTMNWGADYASVPYWIKAYKGGTYYDMFAFDSTNNVKMNKGLSFGAGNKAWVVDTSTNLIDTVAPLSGSRVAKSGVDFTGVAFSDCAFKSTGFCVDNNGNATSALNSIVTWSSLGLTENSTAAAGANCTQLNALLSQANLSTRNKVIYLPSTGTVYTNCTVDIKYPGVGFQGTAQEGIHGVAYSQIQPKIAAYGFSGTLVKMRSVYIGAGGSGARNTGQVFNNITLDSNALAGPLLDIDSISNFETLGLLLLNSQSTAALNIGSGITGTDLSEAADVQAGQMQIYMRQLDNATAQALPCANISGSVNANFSFNYRVELTCQHWDGAAFIIPSADNNKFYLRANRPGGAGNTLLCGGRSAAHPAGCEDNIFEWVSGPGAIYAQGTSDAGVTGAVHNNITWLDSANGTPNPTAGTGSSWDYQNNRTGAQSHGGLNTFNSGVAGYNSAVTSGAGMVGLGSGVTCTGTACTAFGLNTVATGFAPTAFGDESKATGTIGTALGYRSWDLTRYASEAFASGYFSTLGDAQESRFVLRVSTTADTAVRLTADGSTAGAANCINLPDNYASALVVDVVMRDLTTGTKYSYWSNWQMLLYRGTGAGSTTISAGTTPTPITVGTVTGQAIAATADTTNGCLNLSYTPPTGNTDTLHIVARIHAAETK